MFDLIAFAGEFARRYGSRPKIFSAPGRVNLIGEHTDYNEGFVLPFAIDKRTYVGAMPRRDNRINAYSLTIDKGTVITPGEFDEKSGWSLYLKGMAEIIGKKTGRWPGADLLIDSDIPFGAGLSSSAALEVSVGLALATIHGDRIDPVDLALAGQKVEHEYLGVRSGIMDQFTSSLGKAGRALLIDCRSQNFDYIPLKFDHMVLMACDSMVKHSLAGSEYNKRREECEKGVALLRGFRPELRSLRDLSVDDLFEAEHFLPEVIYRRCRHVITENERTIQSAQALRDGDLKELGDLMYLSHRSLKEDYEVSCEELDVLVDIASAIDGVMGARMTGGGFGGSTINLVRKDAVDEFRSHITREFQKKFGHETSVFQVDPSGGAIAHDKVV